MKKFKKVIITALIALAAVAAAAGLSACGHVHDYGEWEDIVNNCTAHVQQRVCSDCGHVETKTLEADGHVFGEWTDIVDTCTEHIHSQSCSVCGYEHTETLEPRGHNFGNSWTDLVNTCTEHIIEERCVDCGYTTTRELIPEGHDWSEWTVFIDSCTDYVEWRVCSKCIRREYREDLTAVGHQYENWTDIIDTCTEHIQVGYCVKCGGQALREVEPKGHTIVGNICVDCGIEVIDGQPLDVTDMYNGTYGYDYYRANDMLKERAFYMRIDAAARKFHLNTDIDATHYGETYYYVDKIEFADLDLTSDEAAAVWKTYKDDNPLYYWISSSLRVEDNSRILLLCYNDYIYGRVRAEKNKLIEQKVAEYAALLRNDDDAYAIALAFHDAIINAIDYAYDDNGAAQSAAWAHNVLGVFEERGGVCEAYTRTYQLLLNYFGVENICVTGTANVNHSWNLVRLDDGNWYWCDLTWDDTPAWEWGISYNYFLVNDTQNVNWQDSGAVLQEMTFLDSHTLDLPENSSVHFLYNLPARSQSVYEGYLRSTFEVDRFSYVIVGRDTVQMYFTNRSGNVEIPETVTYSGVNYSVISLGGFNADNKNIGVGTSVFGSPSDAEINLTLPAGLKFIWDDSLYCSNVKSVTVNVDNEYFRSVDGVLFTKSLKTLIKYPALKDGTEYTIPEECIWVAKHAFANVSNLKTLYLGKNLNSFGKVSWGVHYDNSINIDRGDEAYLCGVLDSITVDSENECFRTDDSAFYQIYNNGDMLLGVFNRQITSYEVPVGVNFIGAFVFDECDNLKTITVADGNEYMTAVGGILYNADVTQILVVPNAIEGNVTIPDTVTAIWQADFGVSYAQSFYKKINLTSISFGANIKLLGGFAFGYCEALTTINFNGSVNAWNKIVKSEGWCAGTGFIRIVCTDGVLDKNGKLIETVG